MYSQVFLACELPLYGFLEAGPFDVGGLLKVRTPGIGDLVLHDHPFHGNDTAAAGSTYYPMTPWGGGTVGQPSRCCQLLLHRTRDRPLTNAPRNCAASRVF